MKRGVSCAGLGWAAGKGCKSSRAMLPVTVKDPKIGHGPWNLLVQTAPLQGVCPQSHSSHVEFWEMEGRSSTLLGQGQNSPPAQLGARPALSLPRTWRVSDPRSHLTAPPPPQKGAQTCLGSAGCSALKHVLPPEPLCQAGSSSSAEVDLHPHVLPRAPPAAGGTANKAKVVAGLQMLSPDWCLAGHAHLLLQAGELSSPRSGRIRASSER